MANITLTCHVGFHVGFLSIENVVGCSPKLPSCKSKAATHDIVNLIWEFKDSQEPWPNALHVKIKKYIIC